MINANIPLMAAQPVAGVRDAWANGSNEYYRAKNDTRQNRLFDLNVQSNAADQERKNALFEMNKEKHQIAMDEAAQGQLYRMAKGLKALPAEQRQAEWESYVPQLRNMGFSEAQIAEGIDTDEELDAVLAAFGPTNPNLKTADPSSVREYNFFNSLTPEGKREYLTMKRANQTVKMGDVTGTADQLNNTFNPISETPGATQEDLQTKISDQQALKEAKGDAAKLAIKKSEEAFDKIAPIRKGISNYDEVIRLVDEGADTGVIASRFPSMKQASIELDTLQGELGLDVIGNTTFGALSASELQFALDTALPKKLEGQALKAWVQRKKAAQEKLLAYTQEAATYLGTPGNTVSGWLTLQKERALDKVPPQALELLQGDPSLKDSFYEKYGVLPDGF